MNVTIQMMVNSCPAPISTVAGISDAILWLAECEVFAQVMEQSDLPNKTSIITYVNQIIQTFDINDTSYDRYNNQLLHVKFLLNAVTQILDYI